MRSSTRRRWPLPVRARRAFALLAVLLLGLALAAPAAGQTGTAQPETDNTVTWIQVHGDGSARWSIQVRTRLETQADVERYRAYQEQVRAQRSAAEAQFRDRMTGVVAAAANATGREMTARNVTVSTSIQEVPRRWGIVTYEVTWTGFAAVDEGTIRVGDVFSGGFFLAEGDRLVVEAPDGYVIDAVAPAPDDRGNGSVSWLGRRDFADGRPSVAIAVSGPSSEGFPTPPGPLAPGGSPIGGSPWLAIGVLLVGILGIGGGIWLLWRRGLIGPGGPADGSPDPSLLTDADRVEALVADAGGRVRQNDVAAAFDWSASKTSRVISGMVEDGRVEKTRIGRENVIVLPADEE